MRHLAFTERVAAVLIGALAAGSFALASAPRTASPALPFAPAWSREYPGTPPTAAAVSDGGWLVAGFADHLEILSITSGDVVSSLPLPAPWLACDRTTCVAADDTTVRAIDLAQKKVRWQKPLASPLALAPTLRSGWVFLTTADAHVAALRDTDGETVWTHAAGARLTGPPSVDGNHIAIATANAEVSLLDVQTGRRLWTKRLAVGIPGAPRLGAGMVYVGTDNRDLLFIDEADGRVKDTQRPGATIVGAPAVDDRNVYTVGLDGVLRAFERGAHALRWYADLPTRPANAGPLADQNLTIVALRTGEFQIFAADGDGKLATAVIPAPGGTDTNVVLQVPPMVSGRGVSTRLVTVTANVGDASKWSATVTAGGATLPLSALPSSIPGLLVTLTPPR